ncbi:MAG: hypothetical protein ACLP6G_08485 [Terriglobales bacterium]
MKSVIRLNDFTKALAAQLKTDTAALERNFAEQNKLREYYIRFRNLEREAQRTEERMERTASLLGTDRFAKAKDRTRDGIDMSKEIALNVTTDLPLWQAIVTIVEHVSQVQVIDIEHVLEHCGRKASRQAIDSALNAHKDMFEIKLRGREKFVSLKGV